MPEDSKFRPNCGTPVAHTGNPKPKTQNAEPQTEIKVGFGQSCFFAVVHDIYGKFHADNETSF